METRLLCSPHILSCWTRPQNMDKSLCFSTTARTGRIINHLAPEQVMSSRQQIVAGSPRKQLHWIWDFHCPDCFPKTWIPHRIGTLTMFVVFSLFPQVISTLYRESAIKSSNPKKPVWGKART